MRRRRKHSIAALATQMQQIEDALAAIEADEAYLPSPNQMQALNALRVSTKCVEGRLSDLETTLWERVKKWQDTPYTASELRRKKILSFIGWWFAGFASLDYVVMGWFTPIFDEPWHRFIASAAISLVFVIWMLWSEKRSSKE